MAIRLDRLRWWHLESAARLDAELFGATAWSAETFWSELARPESRWYTGAFDDDRLVGYAGLMVTDGQGDVQTLAVSPRARRSGLGSRLLQALLGEAERRKAVSVLLEVRADNEAAIGLYSRAGFERIAIRRGYYQPEGQDAHIMQRQIMAGAGRA